MDEENQKITSIYNTRKQEENQNFSKSNYSCSVKLSLVRFMLISMFCIFCFFVYKLILKKNLLENELLKSHRLLNRQNIKPINNLNISLNIEYSKYVHLKITDKDNKRWEIPKDILNKEYFENLNNNENEKNEEQNKLSFKMDIYGLNDYNKTKNFSFDLYVENPEDNQKDIFYSFKTDNNFLFSDNLISFQSYLTSDDIYGFGERIHNFKLEEGVYTIWPIDRHNFFDDGKGGKNLYGHQPIGLHKTKYKDIWLGFVFLNSNAQDVQIHRNTIEQKTILSHKTIGGIIDYYIIVDNSPENVLKDIHYLIGKPILPPYWALGIHQCRWGFKNTSQFENVYNNYIQKKIPIDSMWIDIDAMEKYKIFTLDTENFGDLPNFINNIHKNRAKFIPIIDMGFSYDQNDMSIYNKIGDENNLFIKSGYTKKNLFGKVWPKKNVFPDFFNPNIYKIWDLGLDNYLKIVDYDGIWLDMNEPAHLIKKGELTGEIFENEDDIKKYQREIKKNLEFSYLPGYIDNKNTLTIGSISLNGITYNNERLYNNKPLLSVYQCRQTYNFLKRKLPYERPFILTRSNSFGTGNFAFHWLGDNFSKNDYIKYSIAGIFNYNIFGIPLTGADICGFRLNANGELCARWYNVGAFYPFSRNHNHRYASDQYPWSFGENIENIIKKDILVRYSLIRYFYSQLFLVTLNEKGAFFKPVMFEFPSDKNSYEDIESKIMLGEALLLCAFFDNIEKNKTFTFPKSNFNKYPSGYSIINQTESLNYTNKYKLSLSGKLDELHLFVRGGHIIPTQDTFENYVMNTFYLRQQKLNLIINPDSEGYSKGTIFFDNDEINTIELGNYIRVNLEFKNKELNVEVINKNNINYIFKDNIINKIEIWRINEIIDFNTINKDEINLKLDLTTKKNEIIKGKFDLINNKLIIDFNENGREVNLFTLEKVYFN